MSLIDEISEFVGNFYACWVILILVFICVLFLPANPSLNDKFSFHPFSPIYTPLSASSLIAIDSLISLLSSVLSSTTGKTKPQHSLHRLPIFSIDLLISLDFFAAVDLCPRVQILSFFTPTLIPFSCSKSTTCSHKTIYSLAVHLFLASILGYRLPSTLSALTVVPSVHRASPTLTVDPFYLSVHLFIASKPALNFPSALQSLLLTALSTCNCTTTKFKTHLLNSVSAIRVLQRTKYKRIPPR